MIRTVSQLSTLCQIKVGVSFTAAHLNSQTQQMSNTSVELLIPPIKKVLNRSSTIANILITARSKLSWRPNVCDSSSKTNPKYVFD